MLELWLIATTDYPARNERCKNFVFQLKALGEFFKKVDSVHGARVFGKVPSSMFSIKREHLRKKNFTLRFLIIPFGHVTRLVEFKYTR